MGKNYVLSYINPDTDGVACSIAMAHLLSKLERASYQPGILGILSSETTFVLDLLKIVHPIRLNKVDGDLGNLVLVDTHHPFQLPKNFPFEKVKLIIDHHPSGSPEAFKKAKIDNRRVGAAASIVAETFFEHLILDEKLLKLLGYGIISNTLNFTAPSSTSFDLEMFQRIEHTVGLEKENVSAMFKARDQILKAGMEEALLGDVKRFMMKDTVVNISQLELYDLFHILSFEEVRKALKSLELKNGEIYIFNGVDIKERKSMVFCAGQGGRTFLNRLFSLPFENGYEVFDRILLRKTDFILN